MNTGWGGGGAKSHLKIDLAAVPVSLANVLLFLTFIERTFGPHEEKGGLGPIWLTCTILKIAPGDILQQFALPGWCPPLWLAGGREGEEETPWPGMS